ncbi:hypothetical protein HNR26_002349 [Rhizobium rosettiformans]|uniref:Uncharacterized protein n=2 Tax=Rhizobium rosettiformans TaxID=1368430 RepID=A0A4S8PYV1_9HYPH|nr:hypothetical protein [Rhizobium rosettiformans]MBB5276297.1 hypothetical protein [Rhizobium rosettiformans]THV36927.1 hypothetical protein FAA86_10590 [Rhizobium rosettiformans W3]
MAIDPPIRPSDHPDRFLDCQQALEPRFQALIEDAISAGWGEDEAVLAVIMLGDNHMLAKHENAVVDETLRNLRRSKP